MESMEFSGQRALIRVDLNCPLTDDGSVADDSRISAALPTIQMAIENGAKVILCSHLGRPKGRVRRELSLVGVGARLAEMLGKEILFPDDCIGDGPRKLAMNLREGQVMLLENLRFHEGETKNDDNFARSLASLGQIYINDAFGAAHRAHASVVGVPRLIKDRGAGLLLVKELNALGGLIEAPARPFVVIVGGAKVAGKIGVIENLLDVADTILVGGAMAYTFLAAQGIDVGTSRVEHDKIPLAKRVLNKVAWNRKLEFLLPQDHVCAAEIAEDAPASVFRNDEIPEDMMGLDIGPDTVAQYRERIAGAKTLFWNGPMGVFEMAPFAAGTLEIANAVAQANAMSCVGGGDSVAAIRKAGVTPFITHISTGGGASLEFLEGKELPGVEALRLGRAVADV
jgi:phosphoglycerate kinase